MDVNIAAVLAFAFVSGVTPGPNNVMMMVSGVNYGVRQSLPHYFGICVGFPVMLLCLGLGLGRVITEFPTVHSVVQTLGVLYLLWMAWKIASARPDPLVLDEQDFDGQATDGPSLEQAQSKPFTFFQAALFQWVNGKAWVMVMGAIATYTVVDPHVEGNFWVMAVQILVITTCFFMVGFVSAGVWLMGGVALKPWLSRERWLIRFNQVMGALLALSILPVVWTLLSDFRG